MGALIFNFMSEVDIFPQNLEIPEKFRLTKPYSITHYLCNGNMIEYSGKTTTVLLLFLFFLY
jgi:hypothetical protein